jgi:predicted phosphodiesterase
MDTRTGEARYMAIPDDRLIVISDIHGDADALKSALSTAGIDPNNPEPILCLGDIVGEYGDNEECIELLQEVHATCVKGNHDAQLSSEEDPLAKTDIYIESNLSAYQQDWLADLPDYVMNDIFTAVHGAPLEPQTTHLNDEFSIREAMDTIDNRVLLAGHTHVPDAWKYDQVNDALVESRVVYDREITHSPDRQTNDDGIKEMNREYFNPGSIAEPRKDSTPSFLEIEFGNDRVTTTWTRVQRGWDEAFDNLTTCRGR